MNFSAHGGVFIGQEIYVRAQWSMSGLGDSLRYYISDCDMRVRYLFR